METTKEFTNSLTCVWIYLMVGNMDLGTSDDYAMMNIVIRRIQQVFIESTILAL